MKSGPRSRRALRSPSTLAALALLPWALHGAPASGAGARAAQAPPPDATPVGAEWPMYNKDYHGQRWSELKAVTPETVGYLEEACRIEVLPTGSFEAGPVVVDGAIYVTAGRRTLALDARDCRVLWTHDYRPDQREPVPTNRGVAVANGRVFRGTGDARVLALDAATGRVVWKSTVGDPLRGETVSGVPMAWNGLVFVGLAGGALGIRGRITALEAESGREVWRFQTTPEGEEPGAATWKWPKDLVHGGGGGGSWTSFALDPSTRELFVPVGSPGPVFANSVRRGDNLYTNSLVVLDALTGKLLWWYQLAPNDGRDYDLAAAPILYHDDQQRSVVAFAGKNGYAYALDRATHELLFRTAVTTIANEKESPTPAGVRWACWRVRRWHRAVGAPGRPPACPMRACSAWRRSSCATMSNTVSRRSSFCSRWCGRPTSSLISSGVRWADQSSLPASARKRPGRVPSVAHLPQLRQRSSWPWRRGSPMS